MPSPKVVLVTGCSDGGIGSVLHCSASPHALLSYPTDRSSRPRRSSLCTAFALRGCKVYATARSLSAMSTLAASISRLELDVTSQESVERAVRAVLDKEGRIDILVNNAGAAGVGALLDFDVDQARGVYEVNVLGVLRVSQVVCRAMAERGEGLVINIGSIVVSTMSLFLSFPDCGDARLVVLTVRPDAPSRSATPPLSPSQGNIPTPWAGIYSSTKSALHALTDVLRMEVKSLGIEVMLVAPGAIKSNFGKKADASIVMPEGSLYGSVKRQIAARAQMGQDDREPAPP